MKRKQPDVSIANIKKTKGDTEISIQHPIFRKLQKQNILDKKIAKILSQGKPIDKRVESDNLLAIEMRLLCLCYYRRHLLALKILRQ